MSQSVGMIIPNICKNRKGNQITNQMGFTMGFTDFSRKIQACHAESTFAMAQAATHRIGVPQTRHARHGEVNGRGNGGVAHGGGRALHRRLWQ